MPLLSFSLTSSDILILSRRPDIQKDHFIHWRAKVYEDGVLKVILGINIKTAEMQFKVFR